MAPYYCTYILATYPHSQTNLKVFKHEIFLTELIILSYPIWTGDLGSTAKI
jgi:hypothetical protein